MNLDTENEAHHSDEEDEEEEEEEEEVITDGEAGGWHDDHDDHSSGLGQINRERQAISTSIEHAIEILGGVGASFHPRSIVPKSTGQLESEQDYPFSDEEDLVAQDEAGQDELDSVDEQTFDLLDNSNARELLEEAIVDAAGDYYVEDDDKSSISSSSSFGFSSKEVAQCEDDLDRHRNIDSDSEDDILDDASVDDWGIPKATPELPNPSQCKLDRLGSASYSQAPTSILRPAGRVPSPFLVPAFESNQSTGGPDVLDHSTPSPFPSPEPSSEQPKPKYYAKRTKPVRVVLDDEEDHDEPELISARKPQLARDHSSGYKPSSTSRVKKLSLALGAGGSSVYGKIRKPRLSRWIGDSEDDDVASQASHLPSPKNSPERALSPELDSEPELKRSRMEPLGTWPDVDWSPVVELLDGPGPDEDEGSVLEGMYDGLDEIDSDDQAALEIDGDALQENDEIEAKVVAAEAEAIAMPSQDGLAKLLTELDGESIAPVQTHTSINTDILVLETRRHQVCPVRLLIA